MKKTIVLVIAMLFAISMSAQVKYHPELNIGAGYFFGGETRVHVSTIQGIKIGDYFSVGAGLGLQLDEALDPNNGFNLSCPTFANVKGYLPFSEKKALFASTSVGYCYGPSGTFLVQLGIGARFGKFKLELDYCFEAHYFQNAGRPNNGIMLILGWMFK